MRKELLWIAGGLVAGVIATLIAIFTMGAGHGSNVPGCFVVPWMVLAFRMPLAGNFVWMAAGIVPYAIYAALIGYRRRLVVPVIVVHGAAVAAALVSNGLS